MKLGFIGLGRMGNRMVTKLVGESHEVVVWNRSSNKVEELKLKVKSEKLKVGKTIEDLVNQLGKPRVIWSMLPAHSTHSVNLVQASSGSETGDPTQEILKEVEKYVETDDIVIDGGNAHYTDTQKRFENFAKKGVRFLGIGVSGGLIAAKEGYPLMAGGDRQAYDQIKPILDSLAKPTPHHVGSGQGGGHEYFGEGGAGHFVKMVHNGIEYGVMQSIGEGFGVLEKSPYNLDLVKVAKLYQKGTLLSGFMMQRTVEALEKDPKMESIEGYIEASGEGEWTVEEAKKQKVPVEIIEASLEFRNRSRSDPKVASSFAARLVAALRNAFGGHEVKSSYAAPSAEVALATKAEKASDGKKKLS